ncbi:MAG: hypothetical protein WA151_21970, partial [Desulfatirhabdiaceae bacterium]
MRAGVIKAQQAADISRLSLFYAQKFRFFFLGVNGQHRQNTAKEVLHLVVDVLKLGVSLSGCCAPSPGSDKQFSRKAVPICLLPRIRLFLLKQPRVLAALALIRISGQKHNDGEQEKDRCGYPIGGKHQSNPQYKAGANHVGEPESSLTYLLQVSGAATRALRTGIQNESSLMCWFVIRIC